ncbi:MAG TPA: DUF2142 domain-containing protein [Micromonosporaceae bacterium]|nr:DUF2142 domain-containing protein [Micromonosporaceae bacterium]
MTSRPIVAWALAFSAFFLVIGGWAVAAPFVASADETDHIYRAVGVVSGEVAPTPAAAARGSGAYQTVPAGLVPDAATPHCWITSVQSSAACARPPDGDRTPVRVGSGAGRYNPVYYAAVGLPLRWWPDWGGVLLARLISAAMAAALLAGAAVAVLRHSRHGLMMAGLLTATTPMTMHFAGAVNPNGTEIAAGVALFAGAVPLLLHRDRERSTGLLVLVTVSAVLLAVLRPTGLVYLAAAAAALLLPPGAGYARALLRRQAAWWCMLAVVASAIAAVVWIVRMKSTYLGDAFVPQRTYTASEATYQVAAQWREYLDQMVGVFGWLDIRLPAPAYAAWQGIAATLLVLALVVGGRTDRWRLAVVTLGGVVFPSAMQAYHLNTTGFVTQGRYMLPMLVGVPLLAAFVIEERVLDRGRCRALTRLVAGVLLTVQWFALIFCMARWQRGLPEGFGLGWLNPLSGDWHPIVGSVVPVASVTCGLALLGWLAWRTPASAPGRPDAGHAHDGAHRRTAGSRLALAQRS